MSNKTRDQRPGRGGRPAKAPVGRRRRAGLPAGVKLLAGGGVAVAILFAVFFMANRDSGGAGGYPYEVGSPGPGAQAPPIVLPGTDGRTFDLAAVRGETVLLYFQEGLMCQPCFDQLTEIERNWAAYQGLGIDRMVSVTTDPLGALRQKVDDMGLETVVLSDPDLAVSQTYTTNQYGMMGTSRNGHSFIVVGPDGRIRWRADYGGAPEYTMFVPHGSLLADLRKGLGAEQAGGA